MSLSADGYVAGPDGSFEWVPSEELELVETRKFDGTVYLHYRRRG